MKRKEVTSFAPASVANVGCGFDFMGFAVGGIGDKATVGFIDDCPGLRLEMTGRYSSGLPHDPAKNTAGVAVTQFLKSTGNTGTGLFIKLEKNLPLGSGLGSSASSAAAAVFAANELFGGLLPVADLLPFVMESERVACGSAHADNAAPSLLGGFVVIRSCDPVSIFHVKCPDDLFCTVVHPGIEVNTSDARRILRKDLPIADVTRQCANVAALIAGLLNSDYAMLGSSVHDLVAEPRRLQIIPGAEKAKQKAIEAGALGCGISGSGPSLFALSRGRDVAEVVSLAIGQAFREAGLASEAYINSLNSPGAHLV